MKTNRFLFAIAVSAFVAMNFAGCKGDEETTFDTLFDEARNVKFTTESLDQVVCKDSTYNLAGLSTIAVWNGGAEGAELYYDISVGQNKDEMEHYLFANSSQQEIALEPFTRYYYKVHLGIIYNETIYYTDEYDSEGEIYSMPNTVMELEQDNGENELASIVKWNCSYYWGDKPTTLHPMMLDGCQANIEITSLEDPTFKPTSITTPATDGQCYVKAEGTYPAYEYVYWPGTETIYYLDANKYSFMVTIDKAVGEKTVSLKDTCVNIFMDKSTCVRDMDFNIYRYKKIGNQYWTIDDFRLERHRYFFGVTMTSYEEYEYNGVSIIKYLAKYTIDIDINPQYGYEIYPEFIPKGFHIPTDEEWNELETYYGVESQPMDDYIHLSDDIVNNIIDESKDCSGLFYGNETNIAFKMRSIVGWSDWKGQQLNNEDGLNLNPSGVTDSGLTPIGFGLVSIYMTNTRKTSEHTACRLYSNGYNGVLRCTISSLSLASLRLVKDKE